MPRVTKMYNPKGTTYKGGGKAPKVTKMYNPPKGSSRVQASKKKSNRKY